MKKTYSLMICSGMLFTQGISWADEFEACPTQAFIIQTPSSVPKTYGVDLATGSYTVLENDMGTTKSYNGVGFNYHDNYIYGWDYQNATLGKTGDDYQIVPLTITKDSASASAGNIYVGDIAINENTWYGYRKGKGLFTIPLGDPSSYNMTRVSGSNTNATYNITDLAFHPTDGYIYAITNGSTGKLLRIDPADGSSTNLGTVASSTSGNFIFGAQFFDPSGNLYTSNNANGNIYRVNVEQASPTAELFAYGPSSSSNDGARCALAEVPIGNNVDFGDAPDSYGTLMDSNGARHTIVSGFYLGSSIDNESDGYTYPLSDDASDGSDDEDGVSMPTGFEIGEQAILLVDVTGDDGYLNGWIDLNQNGEFELEEQVVLAEPLDDGSNTIVIDIPSWAETGGTWARFRLSTQQDIASTGGIGDGEVEDYPITLTETGVSINYYPSSSTFTSLAYEDLYPDQGDFDMNDVVVKLRIAEYVKDDKVRRIALTMQLAAMGAAYHNGFGVQLPGVARSKVKESLINWNIDGITQSESTLETEQSNAVFIFTQDLSDHVTIAHGCTYLRTESGCGSAYRSTWEMSIPFDTPVDKTSMPEFPYDPFIFATPNTDHGEIAKYYTGGNNPGRKWEVHLKNRAPTDKFESAYLGARDDAANSSAGQYFLTDNGMAWALEVPSDWQHPMEKKRLDSAYTDFVDFAADSTGDTNETWYTNPTNSLIFTEQ
ncbi:LruC domain-containing protein [Shewanella sp. D64]|uniref:LruC domain-containing protein n=1 Tax=unclassified Shewanella TaxID=196818 RepID=UPI0022BA37AC|nr:MULTISPECIES: LruC domain-containing protein [unclassified Shewanella]MEC4724688.1 LruC domain-containing protein [Shewanella sp. D64]MEC4736518.1 LruC domain-containing protein [Shewanella sp. E94]WBJ97429.1 LruC domain-containing protein [Shewanella sp. MTB7]